MLKKILYSLLFCTMFLGVKAQTDYLLGVQYFQQQDFEKAAPLFEKLWKQNQQQQPYYQYYFKTLMALNEFEKAEKTAKQQAKKYAQDLNILVDQAIALKALNQPKKAENIYKEMFKRLSPNDQEISDLAQNLIANSEYQIALDTYLKGRQILKAPYAFSPELADLYYRSGQKALMVSAYLDWLSVAPEQINFIQNFLQARLDDNDYTLLKKELLIRVQAKPDDFMLAELMMWFFVQKRDFETAFIQAKALEKRFKEGGGRLLSLARVATENKAFDEAIAIYDFLILNNFSENVYQIARFEFIETTRKKLENQGIINTLELTKLKNLYQDILRQEGINANTIRSQLGLASLLASYLNELDSAIFMLQNALKLPGLKPFDLATLKLDLGDYYLMNGDVWEPALLYGQVEREQKDGTLGQDAKFKNARLSFFRGDFDLAADQLTVLKAATSQKTANDALSLALLIQDNLAADSSTDALVLFAKADLLKFRKQFDSADSIFSYIQKAHPNHALEDEILFARGQIAELQNNLQKAITFYQTIANNFAADILADDALYSLANIYQYKLKDDDLAKKYLQNIFMDYNNSTFAVDARKRYRILRGEKLN